MKIEMMGAKILDWDKNSVSLFLLTFSLCFHCYFVLCLSFHAFFFNIVGPRLCCTFMWILVCLTIYLFHCPYHKFNSLVFSVFFFFVFVFFSTGSKMSINIQMLNNWFSKWKNGFMASRKGAYLTFFKFCGSKCSKWMLNVVEIFWHHLHFWSLWYWG